MDQTRNPNNRRRQELTPFLQRELGGLNDQYVVRWDAEGRTVILEECELPNGFTPAVITVTIRVPRSYPDAAPRVELPWCLRFGGVVPRYMLNSGHYLVRGSLGDPIIFWPVWKQSYTLIDVVEQVLTDLAKIGAAESRAAFHQLNE